MKAYTFPYLDDYSILVLVKGNHYYFCWNFEASFFSISLFTENRNSLEYVKEIDNSFNSSPNMHDSEIANCCFFSIKEKEYGIPTPYSVKMAFQSKLHRFEVIQIKLEQLLTHSNSKIRDLIKNEQK